MGTIKDITDLLTQLAKSIKDRELASKLFEIQSLVAQFQAENVDLQKEILDVKGKLFNLEQENYKLRQELKSKNLKTIFHANLLWLPDDEKPFCPTCYDSEHKLMHMHLWDSPYSTANGVLRTKPALKCPKCNHAAEIIKHPNANTS